MNPGFARLYVPVQEPGAFSETAQAGAPGQMAFEFSADTSTSAAIFTPNFERAGLAGSVVVDTPPYRSVSGTFNGHWAKPDSACLGFSSSPCAAADINVTFRIETRNGSCVTNADCTAPATCDSVAFTCST